MAKFSKKDIEANNKTAIFCYIFAPVFAFSKKKDESKWLTFHYKQGLNLFAFEIISIIITIILNTFLKVDKMCIHPKLGIEYICGRRLPIALKLIIIIMITVIIYNMYLGIKYIMQKEINLIPLSKIRNNLLK